MKNEELIGKMIEKAERIEKYCSGVSYEVFEEDTKLVEACVFNLSQIGEYASRIEKNYQEMHSDIPWSQLRGLRNRIVHDYDGVNLLLVWEIIREDMPGLRQSLLRMFP